MRKEHLTYILVATLVMISSIFVTPTAVYARMGMPDLNVAGVSDDGSTYREERAKQERENKKAQAEAPAPISAQDSNQNQRVSGETASPTTPRSNAITDFQNNPNIPKDPGQQHVGMLDNDKSGDPVNLKNQSEVDSEYTEPSKEEIQKAQIKCIETLKENGTEENKAKTVCASSVSRSYAFCLANIGTGLLENYTAEDCLQTMQDDAILQQQDPVKDQKPKGLFDSIAQMLGTMKDDVASLLSSAGEKVSDWWNDPEKFSKLGTAVMNHVIEHPFETAIDVAMIAVAIAGAIPTGGGSVIAAAGAIAGRRALTIAAKEAALGVAEALTKKGVSATLMSGLKGIASPWMHPQQTARFLTKAITDYVTGVQKRVDLVNAVGKARYGEKWGDGAKSLEDMKLLSKENTMEELATDGIKSRMAKKSIGDDVSLILDKDISTRMGEKAMKAYNTRYKWTGRALSGGIGLDGAKDLLDLHLSGVTTEARENDANYDMAASSEEKINEYKAKRTKADIIHQAYMDHLKENKISIDQEYASSHPGERNMTNKTNEEFKEKYGFSYSGEQQEIMLLNQKGHTKEEAEMNKPKFQ